MDFIKKTIRIGTKAKGYISFLSVLKALNLKEVDHLDLEGKQISYLNTKYDCFEF